MLSILLASLFIFGNARVGNGCIESVTTVSGTLAPKGKICSGDLIFEDNFNNLDTNVWKHENTLDGGWNGEFEWYSNNRSNSFVKDGILHIKPTFLADDYGNDFLYSGTLDVAKANPNNECTSPQRSGCIKTGTNTSIINPIKSARMRTDNSFSFKYGKLEARAKIPAGDWLWPAIWMMPRWSKYSDWPVSGEIDIMESRGNRKYFLSGQNLGVEQVASTLHWGPDRNHNKLSMTHYSRNNAIGYDSNFYKYQLEWTQDFIKFSIDDKKLGVVTPPAGGFWEMGGFNSSGLENPWKGGTKMAPFDDQFYIILNLAVGATNNYFMDYATNGDGKKPWSDSSPRAAAEFWEGRQQWIKTWKLETDDSHLKVDYVRVWAT